MWNDTKYSLPEEGRMCDCTTPSGDVVVLSRQRNLWFSRGCYVYFTPVMWRYI